MTNKQVKVFAPATIANIGPGFDVLGVALEQPGDIVIARQRPDKGFVFSLKNGLYDIPANQLNVAAHVANLLLDEFKPPFGVAMVLQKQMPIGSGLGSSGASSAAAALAINALLPHPLAKVDLIRFAIEGERLASGSPHADNVAPALLGGVCLVRSYKPLDIIQIPVKNPLYWVVVHPHIVIQTQTARYLLPENIPLSTATEQWGNIGGLITGFILGNDILVGKALKDVIAEPVRAALIPGFDEAKQAALTAGALGFSISGSGPSVFAITSSLEIATQVEASIKKAFSEVAKLNCDTYISRTNLEGALILEQSS